MDDIAAWSRFAYELSTPRSQTSAVDKEARNRVERVSHSDREDREFLWSNNGLLVRQGLHSTNGGEHERGKGRLKEHFG